MVRTRFAPSPTGSLHIGGVRTALYSWALAKKHGGKFLLRIEDTDQERKIPGTIHFIITELQWLGLNFDEGPTTDELKAVGEPTEGLNLASITSSYGPFIQSLRKEIYSTYAEELIENGYAYRCDCTPDMLERERREQTLRREKPGYSGRCRYRNVPKDS
ncbi:MAG: glutamate--tRNA ligase family protein, partial [Deltaproteobacteria bacterium]|nr:glutamate--tRNA ligase family protein [Deltaproteobacteria bacterium]